MNRLSVFVLILGLITIGGFVGCGSDDGGGPTGPVLTVPHDLVAIPLTSSSISLQWIDEDANGLGYRVERGSGADWTEIGELEFDVTSFTDADLDEGTTYNYRVKSFGRDGDSTPTAIASATTLPLAPSTLVATRLSGTSISLSWTNRSEMDDGIEIQRSTQIGSDYESLGDALADTVESFLDSGLEMRTRYYYRVRALNGEQTSIWSNVNDATTFVAYPYPLSNLELEVINSSQMQLSWSTQSPPTINGLIIERSLTEAFDEVTTDSIPGLANSFNISDLSSSTRYYFRGLAYNDSGNSEYSMTLSDETLPGPPQAPGDLIGETPDWSQVILNWTDNSDDEEGFIVQRKKAEFLDWTEDPVVLAIDADTWVDDSVRHTTTYDYRVRAFNDYGNSEWASSVRVVVPVGPPNTPINLEAIGAGIDKIRLSWQSGSINDDGYLIERMDPGEENYVLFNEVRGSQIFLDEGLQPESEYSYRVIAFKDVDGNILESGSSEPASASTHSLIAFEDDFEAYDLNRSPVNAAYTITEQGTSRLRINGDDFHDGEQSLKFTDGIAGDNFSRVVIRTRHMEKGSVSMWLKLAPEGVLGFMGAGDDNIITFQANMWSDHTLMLRDGSSFPAVLRPEYPIEEWIQFKFEFDFPRHIYNVYLNGQQLTDDLSIQNNDLEYNSQLVIIAWSNTEIEYVYVDELIFEDEVGEGAQMRMPTVPSLPSNLKKITDYNRFDTNLK